MHRVFTLVFLGILVCMGTNALGAECGDVNNDGGIDLGDLVFLISYMALHGPAPADPATGDVDLCGGIDFNDVAYLASYIFADGPVPCEPGAVDCTLYEGGEVTLASVSGLREQSSILVGEPVSFCIRVTNNTDLTFKTACNGFRVYSYDGATWDDVSIDTAMDASEAGFGNYAYTQYVYPNGSGADTVAGAALMIYGETGLVPGDSHILWRIDMPAFDAGDVGKTICLDSSFREPGMAWKWTTDGTDSYAPSWDGPHCFTITEALVALDDVQYGDMIAATIEADRLVTFRLRFESALDDPVFALANGFRVFSEDGAAWTTTWMDSTGALTREDFDLLHQFYYYSVNGVDVDTMAAVAISLSGPGMPAGFNDVPYTINIGPIDPAHVGRTICLDSSSLPLSGVWEWATESHSYAPTWSGPHCFEIVAPTTPWRELVTTPDTLEFFVYEGYPSPSPLSFLVEEGTLGDAIRFQCDWVESFVDIPDPTGMTPQEIEVHVSSDGLTVGEYFAEIELSSPMTTVISTAVVKLTVDPAPPPIAIMDPDTLYTYMVNATDPIQGTLTVGWWEYNIYGSVIDPITVTVPEFPVIDSVRSLSSSPGFVGEVVQVFFPVREFILAQGAVWDYEYVPLTLTGLLTDGSPLTINSEAIIGGHVSGDVNGDGSLDIADLIALVSYMFQGGDQPAFLNAADVDASGFVDIADLICLVTYMFQDGPPPHCE